MQDIKTILVAVGCTEYSQGIYNYGAKLAAVLDADLIIANVINIRDVEAVRSVSALGYNVDQEHYVTDIRAQRIEFIENIISKNPYKKADIVIRVGNPIDELLRLILEKNADMVVMGPKGRTDLEHVLIGSVASKLFRRSPVTLVSYRGEKVARRLRKKNSSLK